MVWPKYYDHIDGHFYRNRRREIMFKVIVVIGWILLFVTSTLFAPIWFFGGVTYLLK